MRRSFLFPTPDNFTDLYSFSRASTDQGSPGFDPKGEILLYTMSTRVLLRQSPATSDHVRPLTFTFLSIALTPSDIPDLTRPRSLFISFSVSPYCSLHSSVPDLFHPRTSSDFGPSSYCFCPPILNISVRLITSDVRYINPQVVVVKP